MLIIPPGYLKHNKHIVAPTFCSGEEEPLRLALAKNELVWIKCLYGINDIKGLDELSGSLDNLRSTRG